MSKYLIVISFDAVSAEDYKILKSLPNFKLLMEQGAYVKEVESVYPTLTYPAHTSIVTGKYPKNHGIVNNLKVQPRRRHEDWFWHRKHIIGKTLYDVAREQEMVVASLLWPVTAGAKIKYNIAEIWPNRSWQNQVMVSLINSSPKYILEMNNRYGHIRKGVHQPELDDFILACTIDTIKNKKPNLMLIHLTDVDSNRHIYGYNSEEAREAILRQDKRLGEIIKALKEASIFESSTIVALGDHSMFDVDKVININSLFRENGFIVTDKNGKIKDWKVFFNTADGSGYVYLKDKKDEALRKQVKELLLDFAKDSNSGIDYVLSSKEAEEFGADPECDFLLEAKKGYYFLNSAHKDIVEEVTREKQREDKDYTFATHGFSPSKVGYSTMLIAYGHGIKPGAIVEKARLIDEGPTFAELLGINLEQCDGEVIKGILL
ncbi:alkaline phosphatase family protein [Clostridium cellulovorans]|uniref:Type I phosphodiesterase/nucleotide pyrophosphatase n=1 Tax=Clostridium cellulovorans (strain ATCC 35296 / DSM 3052 / OCM 3 / 743B) TaxID=573061 RepID=D9SVK3_CLOC7|nr:ectonucleotide pyrophosphatase/phosphodiesterase [Clostridium cellulovorans]ADL51127.1 type I phosphodiesterase/nucleotide pyrophosphatase [Clostridium cellulovorans 743B]